MVHQYKNNGYNIVLDVNSGAIHVVDDVTYDVIAMFEEKSGEEIIEALKGTYPESEIKEALENTSGLELREVCIAAVCGQEKIYDYSDQKGRSGAAVYRR